IASKSEGISKNMVLSTGMRLASTSGSSSRLRVFLNITDLRREARQRPAARSSSRSWPHGPKQRGSRVLPPCRRARPRGHRPRGSRAARGHRRPCGAALSYRRVSVLSEEELRGLMADLESDRVERTESVNSWDRSRDKLCRAICAFANDFPGYGLPGYLLVGVDDVGHPTGLQVTDQVLLKLGGLRTDGLIQPMPAMVVDRVTLP